MTAPSSERGLDIDLAEVTLTFPRPEGGTFPVYSNLDLRVEQGSFTVLLGPSGCGKSTLLNIVDGILSPSSARHVRVLGQDIRTDPEVTRHVAYVFQSPRLLKWKTLRANVEFGLRGLKVQPRELWPSLIDRYFQIVGLGEYQNYYPHQVSGGMQQRTAIIRAWVNEPRILLMDEPFSHLDEISAAELRRELIELWAREEPRRTVLFVTHDINEAVALGGRVVMLTRRPASICHEQIIDLPWPRDSTDERVLRLVSELRSTFARMVGVQA
jgi:NitT/TauT family transport system ATP-binding protein